MPVATMTPRAVLLYQCPRCEKQFASDVPRDSKAVFMFEFECCDIVEPFMVIADMHNDSPSYTKTTRCDVCRRIYRTVACPVCRPRYPALTLVPDEPPIP